MILRCVLHRETAPIFPEFFGPPENFRPPRKIPAPGKFPAPAENISGPGGKFRPPRKNSDNFDTFRKTVTFRRNHAGTLGKADFFRGLQTFYKTDNFFRKSAHFCSSRVLVGVQEIPEIRLLLVPPVISKIQQILSPGETFFAIEKTL